MILSNIRKYLKGEQGIALIATYTASAFILTLSAAAFSRSFFERQRVAEEITRLSSYAAAEGALQSAIAQIGNNAFTGFINTDVITVNSFSDTSGNNLGNFQATINYPDEADWVVVEATGTVNGVTRTIEGRIFLQSNLSKYLIYSDTPTLWLGQNLVFGSSDGTSPNGTPANEDDRAATYHTNDLVFSGGNVTIYGDVHAERRIEGNATSNVYGDTYAGDYARDNFGRITNDGIRNSLNVDDGFADDLDHNRDGRITDSDYPDRHDLTANGEKDHHAREQLDPINTEFFSANNAPAAASRGYGTGSSTARYLVLEPNSDGTQTKVIVYSNQNDFNNDDRNRVTDSFTLPNKAILYNHGDVHVKGEIAGRVSVVASDDIYFDGNLKYSGGQNYASPAHSAAFMAKDKVFFRPESLEVSGIIYADRANSGSSSLAVDSNYNVNGSYRPGDKYNGHLRHYGNLILDGTANTSNYTTDRAYVYDEKIKYYRPPGLPVRPELRTVREASGNVVNNNGSSGDSGSDVGGSGDSGSGDDSGGSDSGSDVGDSNSGDSGNNDSGSRKRRRRCRGWWCR